MKPKIDMLFASPKHPYSDKRVQESFVALGQAYNLIWYCEEIYCTASRANIRVIPAPNLGSASNSGAVVRYSRGLLSAAREVKNVYVHECGVLGIVLCWFIKRRCPKVTVIFDYHDSVFWDFSYHLSKLVRSKVLIRIGKATGLRALKVIVPYSFDFLVGISNGQISQLKKFYGGKFESTEIPNTKLAFNYLRSATVTKKSPFSLFWMGNAKKGRDFELLLDVWRNCQGVALTIAGAIDDELVPLIPGNVNYLGRYKDEVHLAEMLPQANYVGFFGGWRDEYDTGINEIASPNKCFSYAQLQIPMVLNEKLEAVREALGPSVVTFGSERSAVEAIEYAKSNYEKLIASFQTLDLSKMSKDFSPVIRFSAERSSASTES